MKKFITYYVVFGIQTLLYSKIDWWDAKDKIMKEMAKNVFLNNDQMLRFISSNNRSNHLSIKSFNIIKLLWIAFTCFSRRLCFGNFMIQSPVILELAKLTKCIATNTTHIKPLTKMTSFNMLFIFSIGIESVRTLCTFVVMKGSFSLEMRF